MKKLLLACMCFWSIATVSAQATATPNYSQNIAPLIYAHCTTCHRPGEIAPFSLTSYADALSWSSMIKHVTSISYMPPWKPDTAYQHYQKENYLTAAEIQTISDWVSAGSPQGDSTLAPPVPVFPTGSQVGVPSHVISFTQSYTHVGNDTDEYRYFAIPTNLTQDTDMIALEVRPGNTGIVHHALFWEDTTNASAQLDSASPNYGWSGNFNSALSVVDGQLPSYVPGQKATILSNGMAYRLHKNSWLKAQFHYAPTTVTQSDSSTFNFFFAQRPATRYVQSHVMVPLPGVLLNGPFIIPANQTKLFHGTYTLTADVSMLSTMPHMHKLGTSWLVFAITPAGDTIHLVKIGSWDFNWQGNYDFKNLLHLPSGTVVHALAGYDNTSANINNPHNPPVTVSWGENTTDEMYYLPLLWVNYLPGDENLVLVDADAGTATGISDPRFYQVANKLYPVAPNPASGSINVGFTLGNSAMINLKLYDVTGQTVKVMANNQYYIQGLHTQQLDISELAPGVYSLALETQANKYVQRVVVSGK